MRQFATLALLSAITIGGLASVALAEDPKRPSSNRDPNEKICEDIIPTGSRLGGKRVCATRTEWAERRREERMVIDDAQTRLIGPCQTINTHTGAPAC